MTLTERVIMIAVIVVETMLTRFLPFLLFPAEKPTPECGRSGGYQDEYNGDLYMKGLSVSVMSAGRKSGSSPVRL